jgi:hypothetical protein
MSDTLDRSGVSIYPVRQIMLGNPNGVAGSTVGDGIGSIATLDELAGMTEGGPTLEKTSLRPLSRRRLTSGQAISSHAIHHLLSGTASFISFA